MTRGEQIYPEIKRLREDEKMQWREIGARFGISINTARAYYHDPSGEKARQRKARNNGTCVDCGAATKNSGGKVAPDRCRTCRIAYQKGVEFRLEHGGGKQREWTDEAILEALRSVAINGRLTIATYNAAYDANGDSLPSRSTVTTRFGGWAAAHEAAGLRARRLRGWQRFTAESCLDAVRECASEMGRVPTASEYREWAPGRGPSESLVRHRFGPWREVTRALSTSALTGNTPGNQRDPATVGAARGHGTRKVGP